MTKMHRDPDALKYLLQDPGVLLPAWLRHEGGQACALLQWAMEARHPGQAAVLQQVHDLLPSLRSLWLDVGWPDAARPYDLWTQALRTLAGAYGIPLLQVAAAGPAGPGQVAHTAAQHWLNRWALQTAGQRNLPSMRECFGDQATSATLKVLLAEGAWADSALGPPLGHVAQLTLYRVHHPGAHLALTSFEI